MRSCCLPLLNAWLTVLRLRRNSTRAAGIDCHMPTKARSKMSTVIVLLRPCRLGGPIAAEAQETHPYQVVVVVEVVNAASLLFRWSVTMIGTPNDSAGNGAGAPVGVVAVRLCCNSFRLVRSITIAFG